MWNFTLHVKSYDSLAIAQPMNLLAYNQLVIAYFDPADWFLEIAILILFFILKLIFQHLTVDD